MGELFTYFSITGLLNAIISLSLAFYLAITSWKIRLARYLIYLCLALGTWSTGYFLWQISNNHDSALFWSRFLMAGAIFTSISFLHLVVVFLNYDKLKFYKIMLVIFYIFCFFFEILNFTPLFVADVGQRLFFKYWPLPGPFYLPYLVIFALHLIIAFGLLYKKYKHSIGIEKKQSLLLLIGISLTFGGGITNYFLWYDIPIAPWGNGLAVAYAIFSTYAIFRYRLLNIKLIATEICVLILNLILLTHFILSDSVSDFFVNGVILSSVLAISYSLIKSAYNEIHRREEITELAHSLEKSNILLQDLDRQRMELLSMVARQLDKPNVKKTVGQNKRLIKLSSAFIKSAQLEKGEITFSCAETDINNLVSEALAESAEALKSKKLSVDWQKKIDLPLARLDKEKIKQTILKVLDNAIKYSNPGGAIIINTRREDDGIAVWIQDQGVGFAQSDWADLYEKFYRGASATHHNIVGTGLSLYMCRQFVEGHGGRVWAQSRGLGKGSEFGFWIPLKKK